MVKALEGGEIDVAVGLTEGWVSGILKGAQGAPDGVDRKDGFKIVGTYVSTPLRWAVCTGGARADELRDVRSLRGKRVGVSRIGSGSFVMSFVLALQNGWLSSSSSSSSS